MMKQGQLQNSVRFSLWAGLAAAGVWVAVCSADAQPDELAASLPSDTPKTFAPRTNEFDFVKREEMIPMRDGVKLKTFILVPNGVTQAPILLTRTPYNASQRVARFNSPHLADVVPQMDDTAVA